MKRIVEVNGRPAELEWTNSETVSFRYETGEHNAEGSVSLIRIEEGVYSLLWNGRTFEARVLPAANSGAVTVEVGSRRFEVVVRDPREYVPGGASSSAHGHCELTAPMPGKVIRLLVEQGAYVEAGQGIVVVEAMKMQNEMRAARAGTVTEIRVGAGDAVSGGQVLAVIE